MALRSGDLARRLAPFEPSAADPWDARKAAHLLRRAGFGATPEEVAAAVAAGPAGAVERIFAPEPRADAATLESFGELLVRQGDVDRLAAWWLRVMVESADPLRERVALLWHGHFAVSAAKVDRASLLFGLLSHLRTAGLGDLRELARGVVRDPAMLRYLDADRNRKGHPNENLARELFELFLLGIGEYTERDVQEAARALTGLRTRGDRAEWLSEAHDAGEKTIFGVTRPFGPDELVDHCFESGGAARFLAGVLAREFLHPEPPAEVLDALAASLRDAGLSTDRFLRALFASRLFFEPEMVRSRIGSPVEFAVGTLRMLAGRADGLALQRACEAMGQRLFFPPGVQGWEGGAEWLASSRLAARNQFARALATREEPLAARYDDALIVPPAGETGPAELLDSLLARFLPGEALPGVRETLLPRGGEAGDWLHWIITLPEAQLA